ncbi:hypothetical protein J1N35_033192 [Gossypium stocksii]|uniref:RNase H type-1 domain-containing protein n=1 Tax=Gossypium stocksii TaxID=47602 RepID=A0A9D3UPP0_9ROSI|nr:hypothetical protein J1N35_033192 [Gossypium stocksii]
MSSHYHAIMRGCYTYVAEARACERAISFARKMGFHRLLVEGYSLTVIKSIKKKGADRSLLRPITQNIYNQEVFFEDVDYRFVHRDVNDAAHTLALEGRRRQFCADWVNGVPDSVLMVALKDRVAWQQNP